MLKPNVLVMYPTRPNAMAQLAQTYQLHRYDLAEDKDAFLQAHGPDCVAIVTNGHTELTRDQLEYLPKLEIVCCSSAGFEYIDVAALTERSIPFTNSSAALSDDVADLALLLALACRRQLVKAHQYVTSGEWGKQGMYPLLSSMGGKKVGIVGMGQIGKAIATRFSCLNAHIGYTARSEKPLDYRYFSDVTALADWSDVLIVIVPGGAATDRMINQKVLQALGPKGTLINVARGSVVDESALIDALSNGTLGAAGLDVYQNEPNPDPALTQLPNVTLFPHHASGTTETRDAMAQTVVDNLAAHFAGSPLLNQVS